MKTIPLTRGMRVIVDDVDFGWLSQHKWYAKKTGDNGSFYAARFQRINRQGTTIYMHRVLTSCPAGKEVDHINQKPLDNRRANLRVCTKQENLANRF